MLEFLWTVQRDGRSGLGGIRYLAGFGCVGLGLLVGLGLGMGILAGWGLGLGILKENI